MSKLYDKYLELKRIDNNKLYLFKNGNFYVLLDKDCDRINDYMVLKKTPFSKETYKCGFPISSLDQYLRVIKNNGLDVEIIEDAIESNNTNFKYDKIINIISSIDINKITPIDAFNIIVELKEKINE